MKVLIIIALSFALISLTYMTTLFKNMNIDWNIIVLFLFCILIGNVIYLWNKIIEGKESNKEEKISENPKVLFLIVGVLGFFLGNLMTEILNSYSSIVAFPLMILIIFFMYKLFSLGIILKIVQYWKLFLEFKEFCSK
jgi:uncharacterized membrane protein YbjE (DUF340 family)